MSGGGVEQPYPGVGGQAQGDGGEGGGAFDGVAGQAAILDQQPLGLGTREEEGNDVYMKA